MEASIFLPKKAGRGANTRDMSDTGAVTSGDPRDGVAVSPNEDWVLFGGRPDPQSELMLLES